MTEKKRKQHSAEYKFKVALEAAKENKTLSQLASEQEIHPNQISQWKRQLLEEGANLFKRNGRSEKGEKGEGEAEFKMSSDTPTTTSPVPFRSGVSSARLGVRGKRVYGKFTDFSCTIANPDSGFKTTNHPQTDCISTEKAREGSKNW